MSLLLQPAYGSRLVTSSRGHVTRVVCVPAFSAAGEAVLVDLGSLDTRVLAFGVHRSGGGAKGAATEAKMELSQ